MSTTLTIRNLDRRVKQKLREQAARHQRSMEAEARAIISSAIEGGAPFGAETREEMHGRLKAVIGMWEDRGTTDDLMQLTRGEE